MENYSTHLKDLHLPTLPQRTNLELQTPIDTSSQFSVDGTKLSLLLATPLKAIIEPSLAGYRVAPHQRKHFGGGLSC